MKQFALIVDGRVAEIIPEFVAVESEEDEASRAVPLSERYHPDFIAQLVPYDPSQPPSEPELPAPAGPRVVTMRQARLALLAAGHLAAITDAIAALPSPQREAAQIEWEFAATVDRDSATVALLASSLEIDADAIDQLFKEASAL